MVTLRHTSPLYYADRGGCYPPRSKAKVDNTILDLHNSSYPTKDEFNNCFIILLNIFKTLEKMSSIYENFTAM